MTNKEQKTVDSLLQTVKELREENRMFRNDMTELITAINSKVDKKHTPVNLESDILSTVQSAMNDSIKAVLSNYNSPLTKLVASVVDEHSTKLRSLISNSFNEVIQRDEFEKSIVSAFAHKVSRSIISNNDGLFDKVSNELKQDAVFKSKMALAVSHVVEEVLKSRKDA